MALAPLLSGADAATLGSMTARDPTSTLPRLVVADDDPVILQVVPRFFDGFEVHAFESARLALDYLVAQDGEVDAVLSDLHMPDLDGLAFLALVRERWPDLPFVVMTGDATIAPAIEAMRRGAYDYLTKPLQPQHGLDLMLLRAVERRRLVARTRTLERRLNLETRYEGIVGQTPAMRATFQMIETVADTDATVLILGESGTGKELVARALHAKSRRASRPFLAVNCSALTETLLESELFGHVRGAFSGATANRKGLIEEASGGTLFMDEIGDTTPAMQVRLLRAIELGEIKAVGSNDIRTVDVRFLAATNRDLAVELKEGDFREDLFYRLNVVTIELPALRERLDDVPLLVTHFLAKYSEKLERPSPRVTEEAMAALLRYSWPGNLRELQNAVQGAMALSPSGEISLAVLPKAVRQAEAVASSTPVEVASLDLPFSAARAASVANFERSYLLQLLSAERGNLTRAAKRAGTDKSNLRKLARRHGIEVERFRRGGSGG
ncbi:MAG: sigma-54 dependent transcriptional regulator [Polyangiaceae bacterium]|jgi:two-component system response regulator HydG